MASESTKQLLANYHDASKRLEARSKDRLETDEDKETYGRLTVASRELVSRCILDDEPRSLLFLLDELKILLKIVGQPIAAEHLKAAESLAAEHYHEWGTF